MVYTYNMKNTKKHTCVRVGVEKTVFQHLPQGALHLQQMRLFTHVHPSGKGEGRGERVSEPLPYR